MEKYTQLFPFSPNKVLFQTPTATLITDHWSLTEDPDDEEDIKYPSNLLSLPVGIPFRIMYEVSTAKPKPATLQIWERRGMAISLEQDGKIQEHDLEKTHAFVKGVLKEKLPRELFNVRTSYRETEKGKATHVWMYAVLTFEISQKSRYKDTEVPSRYKVYVDKDLVALSARRGLKVSNKVIYVSNVYPCDADGNLIQPDMDTLRWTRDFGVLGNLVANKLVRVPDVYTRFTTTGNVFFFYSSTSTVSGVNQMCKRYQPSFDSLSGVRYLSVEHNLNLGVAHLPFALQVFHKFMPGTESHSFRYRRNPFSFGKHDPWFELKRRN